MKVSPELLEKYARNECTPSEKAIVEKWLKNDALESESHEQGFSPSQEDKIWRSLEADVIKPKRTFTSNRRTVAVAVSVLIIISVGIWSQFFQNNHIIYQTDAGQTQIIVLPDGSKIILNASSFLEVPKRFVGENREVRLLGEAFFEVAKDSLHPFIVNTTVSRTEVLGTEFNLSSYPEEDVILTLNEGKVAFSRSSDPAKQEVLSPNEQVILSGSSLVKREVDASLYNGWLENKLYFDNERLGTIFKKLERRYDIEIELENLSLTNQTYRASYENPTLDALLEDMSFVLDFTYTIRGKQVIIK